jgi:hypothetical protein
MTPKEIMKSAIALGACDKSGKATDWGSLAWLMFTPQGREFCEEKQFPSLQMWRDMKDSIVGKHPVNIDAGEIKVNNPKNIAIIGDTVANLTYSGTDTVHKLIVMHGAKARVRALNYAVVLVVKVGDGCEIEYNNDETARILT